MMNKLYTIGFTKKKAEEFFNLIKQNDIKMILDIRLNNTSQLASFTKYPDISFFLKVICDIDYIHDINLAPTQIILNEYKKNIIDWNGYEKEFIEIMKKRNIYDYIKLNYNYVDGICLLCSEPKSDKCHRRLIANIFKEVFDDLKIINL